MSAMTNFRAQDMPGARPVKSTGKKQPKAEAPKKAEPVVAVAPVEEAAEQD